VLWCYKETYQLFEASVFVLGFRLFEEYRTIWLKEIPALRVLSLAVMVTDWNRAPPDTCEIGLVGWHGDQMHQDLSQGFDIYQYYISNCRAFVTYRTAF
jgi:hypothetical protein